MSANESLGRAQELAERLRAKLDGLEQLAEELLCQVREAPPPGDE